MKTYETSSERRRLPGRTERRGVQTGFSTAGAFLFGAPFVGLGVFVMLVGTKVVAVNPRGVHAPYWVLTVIGAVFALAGFIVWGMAWRQRAANQRRAAETRVLREEPALRDFAWNPRGYEAPRWSRAAKAVALGAFLTLFLSVFNYAAWWMRDVPWFVKGVVALFDLILLAVWWAAFVRVGRALKFGGSRVEFGRFPYRLPGPVTVRWQPASGITEPAQGTFTLRCVREWLEQRGRGRNRTTTLVQEEIWSGTWRLDEGRTLQAGKTVELEFELPAGAAATELSAERPVFWEFEVKLELPGLNFEEIYLVPIYGERAAGQAREEAVASAHTA